MRECDIYKIKSATYNIGDSVYINGVIYDEIESISDNKINLKFHRDMSFGIDGQEISPKCINHFLSKLYYPKIQNSRELI